MNHKIKHAALALLSANSCPDIGATTAYEGFGLDISRWKAHDGTDALEVWYEGRLVLKVCSTDDEPNYVEGKWEQLLYLVAYDRWQTIAKQFGPTLRAWSSDP